MLLRFCFDFRGTGRDHVVKLVFTWSWRDFVRSRQSSWRPNSKNSNRSRQNMGTNTQHWQPALSLDWNLRKVFINSTSNLCLQVFSFLLFMVFLFRILKLKRAHLLGARPTYEEVEDTFKHIRLFASILSITCSLIIIVVIPVSLQSHGVLTPSEMGTWVRFKQKRLFYDCACEKMNERKVYIFILG